MLVQFPCWPVIRPLSGNNADAAITNLHFSAAFRPASWDLNRRCSEIMQIADHVGVEGSPEGYSGRKRRRYDNHRQREQ